MRVTILTQGSVENGSAYFRAIQYAPLLAARGFDVAVSPADVPSRRLGGPGGAALLLAEHGLQYLRRGLELQRVLEDSDAILIQRGAYPIGPATLLRGLRRFRGPVVYDLDDATFLPTPTLAHRSRAARWVYRDRQSLALLDRADTLVVSTPELGQVLPGRRAHVILPTIPDVWAYPTATQNTATPVRLGWIGSQGNVRYLDPLRGVVERLTSEGVARLEVVTAEPWAGPATFRRWERSSEADAVADFEVGLMPLPDSPYTKAKAGFKLLQYMAAGCAVIASPVGINSALVEESGAGLLATTPVEWERAIRMLAGDSARRASLGAAGQRYVRSFADRERHADHLAALLRGERAPVPLTPQHAGGLDDS